MILRTQLRLAWGLVGLLALATVAVAVGLAAWPLEPSDAAAGPQAQSPDSSDADAPRALPPLSAYAVLWEKDLQRPLFDLAPTVAKSAPAKPPVRLAGTVIEPQYSYALLKDKAGQVKMVAVGQALEGAEVLAVTADSVTVRFAGAEHVLKVEKEGQAP